MNERDRVLQVMQSEGMNAKQFCQEVGISPGTLSNITGGRNKPSLDVMQAILRRFRAISCDWLIMGVGTMYVSGAREECMQSLFEVENETTEMPKEVAKPFVVVNNSDISSTAAPSISRKVDKILIFYSDGTFEER
jgi:transcriptional regulator with XRE-family HTH domain